MATRSTQTRAKFAYLKYESMLENLADETLDPKKKLNAYDVNFDPDTKQCYVIAPDLTPWAVKSKVFTFDSVEEAIDTLNGMSGTYAGQIVSILKDDKYVAYIVNNLSDGYIVTPLNEYTEEIDYNTLGNRPITNLVGTSDEPIIISELDNGLYCINGNTVLPNGDECVIENYFVLKSQDAITVITSNKILKYQNEKISEYITEEYLISKGYATTEYIDQQIIALDEIINEKVKDYVNANVNNLVQNTVNEELDKRMTETFILYGGSAEEVFNLE